MLYSGEFTAANGTQYLRARWYNPRTGTFNRLDPYAGNTSDPLSLNKYLYTHSNPAMGIDPSGEFSLAELTLVTGIIGTLAFFVKSGIDSFNNFVLNPTQSINAQDVPQLHREMALLSSDVYNATGSRQGAWRPVTDAELSRLGINTRLFNRDFSGFFARLYLNAGTGTYALAFRGTEVNSLEGIVEDGITDIIQGSVGPLALQFVSADEIAKNVKRNIGASNLLYTGHSLGGGLAAMAATSTGDPAINFNAAGLHDFSKFYAAPFSDKNSLIVNYSVSGEILTTAQLNTGIPNTIGQRYWLQPAAADQNASTFALHGMDFVLRALGLPTP